MKNKSLFELDVVFKDEVVCSAPGVKFALLVSKISEVVSAEVEKLKSAAKPSDEFITFEQTRLELCRKYCEKNEDGTPKVSETANQAGVFVFSQENIAKFEKEFKPLAEENKDLIEQQRQREQEYMTVLEDESDIELTMIPEDVLPDTLTLNHIKVLKPIIEMKE